MNPELSVAIPNYNNADYVKTCLQSVCNQTLQPIEILFIDDASTDTSIQIAKTIHDSRLSIVKNTINKGRLLNINFAFQQCLSPILTLLPSDDYWLTKTAFKRVKQIFDENKKVVLVFCGTKNVTNTGDIERVHQPFHEDTIFSGKSFLLRLLKNNLIFTSSVFVRKDILEKIGYFDEHIDTHGSRDWLTWLKFCFEGDIAYCHDEFVAERIHTQNITSNYQKSSAMTEHELDVIDYFFQTYNHRFSNEQEKKQYEDVARSAWLNRAMVRAIRQKIVLLDSKACQLTLQFINKNTPSVVIDPLFLLTLFISIIPLSFVRLLKKLPMNFLFYLRKRLFYKSSPNT